MNYVAIINEPKPFSSPVLPTIRERTKRGVASKYSKAEQKRIVEHGLYHKINWTALAKHFNVSMPTMYAWKRDYLMGMYADEVIYNHTIAFRRSA